MQAALYADRERGRYPVWQSLDHPEFVPGSGILFGTVTVRFPLSPLHVPTPADVSHQGAFSRRIEALPKAQVLSEVMSVLGAMFPNTTIPEPLDFHYKLWSADPLFRGSYATWPPSFLPEHHVNLRADVAGRVWFAGEATSKYHFGMYLSCSERVGVEDMAYRLSPGCVFRGERDRRNDRCMRQERRLRPPRACQASEECSPV